MSTTPTETVPPGTTLTLQALQQALHTTLAPVVVGEKTREVRLGLVLYGGVSLAIYINGVAREFFRAVHGQGIYRLVKALTDSDIVVDVISGTSAGGVNGIMLAYALCNNKDLASTAELWRQHGGITNLLRSPFERTPPPSLLNSEGYYQPKLEEAFRQMPAYQPEVDEDASAYNELDLFITGTDVDGRFYTQFDDAGHPIDIKDHRSVFLLKHRQGRKEPFNPHFYADATPEHTIVALATLARITSCFPAAFAPVPVACVTPGHDSPDAMLQQWGQLGKEAYFLDGGVLDNKPFTYTIKAIFSRMANRDVDRKLFFVEPDPEAFTPPTKATNPNFLQAVLASLLNIPGYESIAEDLKLLTERNSKLAQYQRLVDDLWQQPPATLRPDTAAQRLYQRSRLVAFSERIIAGLFKTDGQSAQIVSDKQRQQAARLVRLFDQTIATSSGVDVDQMFADLDVSFCLRRTFHLVYLLHDLLYRDTHALTPKLTQEPMPYRELRAVLNRQIKLYEVLWGAIERLLDEATIDWETTTAVQIWATVHKAMRLLLHDDLFRQGETLVGAQQPILPLQYQYAPHLAWLPQPLLTDVNTALQKRLEDIKQAMATGRFDTMTIPNAPSLLGTAVALEKQAVGHFLSDPADPIRQVFEHFEALDTLLFPLEIVGNLQEKDIIETIRISPKDAKRGFSDKRLADKVSGDAVYHFGGFFKRSWRSNDILWGRLDGLCQLVETLLMRDRLAQIVAHDAWREVLRQRFFQQVRQDGEAPEWRPALDPARLFPGAGAETHRKCRTWIAALLSDKPETRDEALAESTVDDMVSLLIEAAQLEVLHDEVPSVIEDALDEQYEWNRYVATRPQRQRKVARTASSHSSARPQPSSGGEERRAADAPGPSTGHEPTDGYGHNAPLPWMFATSRTRHDPFVSALTTSERMHTAMAALSAPEEMAAKPRDTRLGRFFRLRYKVGAEQLTRDIPTLVLLEILATALLVMRNAVLGLFGDHARRIERSLLYRLGLSLPLRVFHALVSLSRRAPGVGVGVLIGLFGLSLIALLVGILGRAHIFFPGGVFSLVWFAAFIVVPFLLLCSIGYILIHLSKKALSNPVE